MSGRDVINTTHPYMYLFLFASDIIHYSTAYIFIVASFLVLYRLFPFCVYLMSTPTQK
jgi:hypothetical protein